MKLSLSALLGLALAIPLIGCSARPPVRDAERAVHPSPAAPPRSTNALARFLQHDDAQDWSPRACAEVAAAFAETGDAPAQFDAGITWQRCGDDARARVSFERALASDPTFGPAKSKLALYRFRADGDADAAIRTIEAVVIDTRFGDPGTLVDLASVQRARSSGRPGTDCSDDLDCAKRNLQRALAIDDAYAPAHNELALTHLALARRGPRLDVQQLELAALVCTQAIAKRPRYAPVHNTAALVAYALGRTNEALGELTIATMLDPRFFEAQMNLGAMNLELRGWEQARIAYGRAVALRPDAYDAHLGIALALRGPLRPELDDPVALRAEIADIHKELETAKRIDPTRPEAWFNEAIALMELARGADPPSVRAAYARAETALEEFLSRAKRRPDLAVAVRKAHERLGDIADTRSFFLQLAAPASSAPLPPSP